MYHLSQEIDADWWEVEALFDLCFAPGREALSSYRLRDGIPPVQGLCIVARDDEGIIAAAVRFWPVKVGNFPVLLLGPIAVHPTRQGEGLGGFLIAQSINDAQDQGWERMLLVGDAPYYSRFGFFQLPKVTMPPPTNPDRVLGLELKKGAWNNVRGLVVPADQPN